jgi:HK97 family phage portal protein
MNRLQRTIAALFDIRAEGEAIGTSRELMKLLESGAETDSGAIVTQDSAMRTSAVFSCVRVVSEDVAKLPLHLYQRQPRGKARVTDHWLARLLQQPNSWQSGFEFREMQQAHIESAGKFFAIKTVVRDEVRELLPIIPTRVTIEQFKDYSIVYKVRMPNGTELPVPADRMLHVRGMTLDGINGLNPIQYQRQSIGLAMQTVKYGARMFKNGTLVGGVLKNPNVMSEEAATRLKESFQEKYGGVDNAHKIILLEEGTEFTKTGMTAEDARWIESMKFSRTEIAGFFRVPPHLIADLERATFANIEQQSRDYVQNGLLPRLRRLETRYLLSLIPEAQRQDFFVEHLVDFLLRGDYQQRMAGYQTAIQSGWLTRNEVRELENMNPGPPALDEFLTPMNMNDPSRGQPPKDAPPPADPSAQVTAVLERIADVGASNASAIAAIAARPTPAPQLRLEKGAIQVDVHNDMTKGATTKEIKTPDGRKFEITERET